MQSVEYPRWHPTIRSITYWISEGVRGTSIVWSVISGSRRLWAIVEGSHGAGVLDIRVDAKLV